MLARRGRRSALRRSRTGRVVLASMSRLCDMSLEVSEAVLDLPRPRLPLLVLTPQDGILCLESNDVALLPVARLAEDTVVDVEGLCSCA